MARREDWPERLAAFVEARLDMPFQWGPNDCSSFGAAAVVAMTGELPALPTYAGERDALRLIAERSLRARVGEVMGDEIAVAFAQRGDIGLLDVAGRETVAVCLGDLFAVPGTEGVLMLPRESALCAWRV